MDIEEYKKLISDIRDFTGETKASTIGFLDLVLEKLSGEYIVSLGIDVTKSASEILDQLVEHYKKLTSDEEKGEFAAKIAGRYNTSRMLTLLEIRNDRL